MEGKYWTWFILDIVLLYKHRVNITCDKWLSNLLIHKHSNAWHLIELFFPYRKANRPGEHQPEEVEGEGPEGDPIGLGRAVSRLHREERLREADWGPHAQVRQGGLGAEAEGRVVVCLRLKFISIVI